MTQHHRQLTALVQETHAAYSRVFLLAHTDLDTYKILTGSLQRESVDGSKADRAARMFLACMETWTADTATLQASLEALASSITPVLATCEKIGLSRRVLDNCKRLEAYFESQRTPKENITLTCRNLLSEDITLPILDAQPVRLIAYIALFLQHSSNLRCSSDDILKNCGRAIKAAHALRDAHTVNNAMQVATFYTELCASNCKTQLQASWLENNVVETLECMLRALFDMHNGTRDGALFWPAYTAYAHGPSRRLAFASVLHSRLGQHAAAARLPDSLIEQIAKKAAPDCAWAC